MASDRDNDDGPQVMRITHMFLWVRWAKKVAFNPYPKSPYNIFGTALNIFSVANYNMWDSKFVRIVFKHDWIW